MPPIDQQRASRGNTGAWTWHVGALPLFLTAMATYVEITAILCLLRGSIGTGLADTAQTAYAPLVIWAGLILGYLGLLVLGIALASVLGLKLPLTLRRRGILALATIWLALAAASGMGDHIAVTAVSVVLATGAFNAVYQAEEEQRFGFLFLTTILTHLGRNLAEFDNDNLVGWVPDGLKLAALIAGAAVGLAVYPLLETGGLAIAALMVAVMAALQHESLSEVR
ncbi:MAG: DUF1275 family protein [Sphingomonas sp.]|jgi:hypothetical protein|uniref:DUF1275 family protein n=1 Tax=Sphingomonas sp. TaxID=28214 RepID=UPI003569C4EC